MNPAISTSQKPTVRGSNSRLQFWYLFIMLILAVFIGRLFYLQVIRNDHYRQAAMSRQYKQYAIPSERGTIRAHMGDEVVPLVLNQNLYTVFADPLYVKNPEEVAGKLVAITGGSFNDYADLVKTKGSRYVVLAKKLSKDQKDKIDALKLRGVGTREVPYRIYPQGTLASQLLGFVDADGVGRYGLEQALNGDLSGKPGELKAITDISGVPLVDNRSNIKIDPIAGKDVVLSVDIAMQKQLEAILAAGLKHAESNSGSAMIMEANTGKVLAMANLPTYDPANYEKASDISVFNNDVVASTVEPGSSMKIITMASALDQGVVTPDTSYSDPSRWVIDGHTIKNVEEDGGAGTRTMGQLLNLSLNTGATWLLMQMSKPGATEINEQGRNIFHSYLSDKFQFGKETGIEQGYESVGLVPDPKKGDARNLTYANAAFGQSISVTLIQMAAAYSSILNGGTYYQPTLIDGYYDSKNVFHKQDPKIVAKNVVSQKATDGVIQLLQFVAKSQFYNLGGNYSFGGKTGTAQIASPDGGYYADKFNGTYIGFVGGDKPQYVIAVRVNEPKIGGYAGPMAAKPIYLDTSLMLINNFGVTPKLQ